MKIRRSDGFSTVYLVLIMGTLIFLILIVFEAASGNAASAAAENICLVSGRSVLSEFQPSLYARYGVFALRARDEDLSEMAEYYISGSCEGRGVLSMGLKNCEICTEKYPGLSTDVFSEQISRLGALCAAKNIIDEADLAGIVGSLSESEALNNESASGSLQSLNELQNYSDAEPPREDPETGEMIEAKPESSEAKATRKQAKELLRRYKDATDPDIAAGNEEAGKVLSRNMLDSLPTRELGIKKTISVALSGGILSDPLKSYLSGEYILSACSDRSSASEDSDLKYETEYILYGDPSDEKNAAAVKRAVWGIRFTADLAEVLADPAKMSELSSVAASAFSFIPLPVAVFILASIEAGIKAGDAAEGRV